MRKIILIVIVFYFAICITTIAKDSFYIKTEATPSLSIPHDAKFYILIDSNTSIEEQKTIRYLESNLTKFKYNITKNIEDADYRFVFKMDTPSYNSSTQIPFPSSQTTYHRGRVGGSRYSGLSVSNTTNYLTVNKTRSFKKGYLSLYKYDKETDQNLLVWSSFTSIKADKYLLYEDQIMDSVVLFLGDEYEGDIPLKKN
jgi:hypothetical protein